MSKAEKWGLPVLVLAIIGSVVGVAREGKHLDSLEVTSMTCDEIDREVTRLRRCFAVEFNYDMPCPASILDPRVREIFDADEKCSKKAK